MLNDSYRWSTNHRTWGKFNDNSGSTEYSAELLDKSHLQFVESLLWPLIDWRYRAVIVEVVELLPDEELGVARGGG